MSADSEQFIGYIVGGMSAKLIKRRLMSERFAVPRKLTSTDAYDALFRSDVRGTLFTLDGAAVPQGAPIPIGKLSCVFSLSIFVETYNVQTMVDGQIMRLPLVVRTGTALDGTQLRKLLDKFGLGTSIKNNASKEVAASDLFTSDSLRIATFVVPGTSPSKPVLGTILGHAELHAAGKGIIPLDTKPGETLTSAHVYSSLYRNLRVQGTLYTKQGTALLQTVAQPLPADTRVFMLNRHIETFGVRVRLGDDRAFILPLSVACGALITGKDLRSLCDKFVFTNIRYANGAEVRNADTISARYIEANTFLLNATAPAAAAAVARPGGACRRRTNRSRSAKTLRR